MTDTLKETWEFYTASWKAETSEEKYALFKKSLDPSCAYTDPIAKTNGWEELTDYMLEFHQQVPGGYFETTYFLAHNNKSIAKWDMKTGDDVVIGEGISYGEYSTEGKTKGKLMVMTGFFETPPQIN